MQSIVYVLPIRPGKTEEIRRVMDECGGRRRDLFADSRQRLGELREISWIQKMPGMDWLITYIEADDTAVASERFAAAKEPFDEWFKGQLAYGTGIDFNKPMVGPPPEVLFHPNPDVGPGAKPFAVAMPVLPGKTAELREWLGTVTDPRSDYMSGFMSRNGMDRIGIFLHTSIKGDMAVLYVESGDPLASRDRLVASEHPDDVDWKNHLHEYTGVDYANLPTPPEQVFYWEDELRMRRAA